MAKHDISMLRKNPQLPNIVISQDKINLFIDWYNKDIRFLKEVPHTFEQGYLILNSKLFNEDTSVYNTFIKTLARQYSKTYREMENLLKQYIENVNKVTIYFKFDKDNMLYLSIYGKNNKIISKTEAEIGDSIEPNPEIMLTNLTSEDVNKLRDENQFVNDVQNQFNYYCLSICISSLWYLATTTKTTKYNYKEHTKHSVSENKRIVYVKENKTVSTPIFNIDNIRIKNVDRLINKRQGYTYSHSFQVHGHYRHYKDGKVVFVNSYIKGKDKPFKHQNIILDPKE